MRRKHPLEGRQLIVEEALFALQSESLVLNNDESKLLVALSNCTEVKLSHGMRAIHCGHNLANGIIGADIIFTRDFYEDLLHDIRLQFRCVLIGSPGIGKSIFQFYYLARIMNPKLFGDLSPDFDGCTDSPKLIVRQVGKTMTVYDIENRLAYKGKADKLLLECFDPKVTLYFYEPAEVKTEEPFFFGLNLATLATVSPRDERYHEFRKNRGQPKYMPTYTLDELLTVGEYLLQQDSFPKSMITEFSKKSIIDRYVKYGGIIRHALPPNTDALELIRGLSAQAIIDCDATKLLTFDGNIEKGEVSHFIMQMNVSRTVPNRFKEFLIEFVSDDVRTALEAKIAKVDLKDRIATLIQNDETGYKGVLCQQVYETVVADLLTSPTGLKGMQLMIPNDQICTGTWDVLSLTLNALERGKLPLFSEMKETVLYYPTKVNFPAVEFCYRDGDRLIGFQITRQKELLKKIKLSALSTFLATVNVTDYSKVTLYLVPTPSRADKSSISFRNEKNVTVAAPVENYVIKLPPKYV